MIIGIVSKSLRKVYLAKIKVIILEHVFNVWKAFKMKAMKDYYDLYLNVYVLLLACIFKTS